MIRLIAKVGLIVDFSMPSAQAEAELVRKFNLEEVSAGTVLNLGKHGKIQVGHIQAMSLRKQDPAETKASEQNSINDIFRTFDWSNK